MSSRDLFTTWASLVACLCEQLDPAPPCFCGMFVGAAAMPPDSCLCGGTGDRCGTAWVGLASAYPSSAFPTPDVTTRGSCTAPLAWRFNVGVVRCQPGPGMSGKPPGEAAYALAAQRAADDLEAAYRTIECCFPGKPSNVLLGQWQPLGNPDGLCAGGSWPVAVWSVV